MLNNLSNGKLLSSLKLRIDRPTIIRDMNVPNKFSKALAGLMTYGLRGIRVAYILPDP